MKTIIVDPFPRKMELIFKSSKLKLLKTNRILLFYYPMNLFKCLLPIKN